MQARLLLALVAVGAHLGHARVIEGARAPALLDARAHRRDAGARLAGVHGHRAPEAAWRSIPRSRATCSRCSAYDGVQTSTVAPSDSIDARRVGESWPPPGIARAPSARAPSKPAQKPMKRPNENGKKTRSSGRDAGAAQHEAPAARPPLPRRPASRASGAAARSCPRSGARGRSARADTSGWCRTAGARPGPRPARPCACSGSRAKSSQPREVARGRDTGVAPLARAGTRCRAERPRRPACEAAPLVRAQARSASVERLQRAVVHGSVRSRSLKRWILPVAVFGSSATNSIQRGYLYGAILSFTKRLELVGQRRRRPPAGSFSTTKALRLHQAVAVLPADHGGLQHGRVLDERALDLDRRDPDAADLQHVVGAAGVPEVAVGVLVVLVAGLDPVAEERLLGLLVLVPVVGHGRVALDAQVADLALRHRRARRRPRRSPRSPGTGSPVEPGRTAPGRFEMKMCRISVVPMPSMISTPNRSLPALVDLLGQRLAGRDAQPQATRGRSACSASLTASIDGVERGHAEEERRRGARLSISKTLSGVGRCG